MAVISSMTMYKAVYGTSDNDTIDNDAGDVTIYGGAGDDSVFSWVNRSKRPYYTYNWGCVTIDGGDGNDSLVACDVDYLLIGGAGDDYIHGVVASSKVDWNKSIWGSVRGGKGDDTIELQSRTAVEYANGDGDDTLLNYSGLNTIKITDDSRYTTLVNGNDVIISFESGSMLLKDASDTTLKIVGGTLYDPHHISNTDDDIAISGTDSDDTIENSASGVTINGGGGDDSIKLNGSNQVIEYVEGDGDDTVANYSSTDTINITDGSLYETMTGGNDVIISLDGGSMLLKDAANLEINIEGGELHIPNFFLNMNADSLISGTDEADTITNFAANTSILGGDGNDTIINNTSYTEIEVSYVTETIQVEEPVYERQAFTTTRKVQKYVDEWVTIPAYYTSEWMTKGSYYQKDRYSYVKALEPGWYQVYHKEKTRLEYVLKEVEEEVTEYQDVSVGTQWVDVETETMVETPVTIQTYNSGSTINAGAGNDMLELNGSSQAVEYGAGDGYDTVYGYNSSDTINIIDGSLYDTLVDGNDMIVSLESGSMLLIGAADLEINIEGGELNNPHYFSNYTSNTMVSGTDEDDTLDSREANNVTINGGTGDDYIILVDSSDVVVEYAAGDGNDTILGVDANYTIRFAEDFNYTREIVDEDEILKFGDNELTLWFLADTTVNIIGGRQIDIVNTVDNTLVSGTDDDDGISLTGSNVTIDVPAGNDTVYGYDSSDKILLGDGDLYVTSVVGDDVIVDLVYDSVLLKDAADQTINIIGGRQIDFVSTEDEDWVIGTSSDDVISISGMYMIVEGGGGNDTVCGYNSSDCIMLDMDDLYTTSTVGNDVLIDLVSDSMLLKGAANLEINIESGSSLSVINADNEWVSGTYYENAISLVGSNITLEGNRYDAVVFGYASSDVIVLDDDALYTASTVGSDVLLSIGNEEMLLKDAAKETLNVIGGRLASTRVQTR